MLCTQFNRLGKGLLIAGLVFLFPQIQHAQTELGQPDIWYSQPAQPFNPNQIFFPTGLIGNHPILSNDSVSSALKKFARLPERGHSIFLVVRPLYNQPSGKSYLRCKGLEITDTEILYRGAGREFVPDQNRPLILSASFPAYRMRGGVAVAPQIDTNMFEVAEVIAYNRFFSKQEMRLMEAYLSLKYSIPTTKNEDKSLRSYPGDSTSSYYWTPQRDKVYDREVIALGNFPFSGLQQSQTVAYHEDSLIVALDTIVPFGTMPQRYMHEGSFMVLSKRIDQSETFDCELYLNQQFPITAWRLRTQNFQSPADSLRLYYPQHQNSTFNDTIILTDGLDTISVKSVQYGSDLAMALALADLKANRIYRFRVKGNSCDDTASVGIMPQGPGLMALNVDSGQLPVEVELNALQGEAQYDTTMYETPLLIEVGSGQYDLWVKSQEGDAKGDFLVAGPDSAQGGIRFVASNQASSITYEEGQRIVVYPNPGFTGEKAHFEFHEFPIDESLRIEVYDPQGRLMHQEEISIQSDLQEWTFRVGIPGAYTFIFHSQDQAYSQKLTVKKRF